jgi:glucokinase
MYGCLLARRSPRLIAGATPKKITAAAAGESNGVDPRAATDVCRLFTEFLGQYAGNLGVVLLPTGGMYLGGNIADVIRRLDAEDFDDRVTRAFLGAGSPTHRPILADKPLELLAPTDTGLLGAAQIAAAIE